VKQLALDGREIDSALVARALTDSQRAVLAYVRACGVVRTCDIEQVSDACGMLARLQRRGLVCRMSRGYWRAVIGAEDWDAT
jgi:hypothetical protein